MISYFVCENKRVIKISRKEQRKNREKRTKKIIMRIIQIIFIILLIVSVVNIIIWIKNNNDSKKIKKELSSAITVEVDEDNKSVYKIDFKALKEKNTECVAWLKVNNTNIEYPVVKGDNNSFYLDHSFDGSVNYAGWPFADYKNNFNGTDKNIVVYGHNRRDGEMFGTLKNVLTEEWYNNNENYRIVFATEKEYAEYQVFSVYEVLNEEYYITTSFSNSEFEEFINTIKSRSVKDFGVNVTTKDKILTLSTCSNNNKYRTVLHAVKIEKGE